MREGQAVFERTGGLHASGLFDPAGTLLALREDVGRHNALDKLVGWAVLAGLMPLHDRILMVSGRVSLEIVQKAAVAGIPIVCAVSAPSDLAVEAAERFGQTLVGFLRGDGFNVYTGRERIHSESDARPAPASRHPPLAALTPGVDQPPGVRLWTKSKPKRPLTHRWPSVTDESSGEVTFTISLSWTCRLRVQPTPQ